MEENSNSLINKIKTIFIRTLEWAFSLFGFIMALAGFLSNENTIGILIISIGSLYLFPLTNLFLLVKFPNLASWKLRLVTFFILFIAGLMVVSINKKNEIATNQTEKESSGKLVTDDRKISEAQLKTEKNYSNEEIIALAKSYINNKEYEGCIKLIQIHQKSHKLISEIRNLEKKCENLNAEKLEKERNEENPAGVILFLLFTPGIVILIYGFSAKCPSCKKWFSRKLDKKEYLYSNWRHTRKDGLPDLRYKSNPETKIYKRYFHCKRCEHQWDDIIRR
ncbi:hypothetical protein JWG45_13550 [Leptospira sp. 201903070]|uniref:Uncharacterized protein n=1 Tax=Leptospira ainlahdjerensis TaxID=2810033 RepID=A0ABS2UFZ8_9LEPT|nr:hypothetical protein [Leptospira ainlahdjerensis]MBM9578177.1 hypothetical protein [Leptospira ainlahdjerensis]